MYNLYLTEDDLIMSEHFPVIALINEACNSNPFEFISNIANKIGGGYDYSSYSFWDDLDEYDKSNTPKFDGLWVGNESGEEIILSTSEVKKYLEVLYTRLQSTDFSELNELRSLIDSIS